MGMTVPCDGAEADRANSRVLREGLDDEDPGMGLATAPEARSSRIVLSILSLLLLKIGCWSRCELLRKARGDVLNCCEAKYVSERNV